LRRASAGSTGAAAPGLSGSTPAVADAWSEDAFDDLPAPQPADTGAATFTTQGARPTPRSPAGSVALPLPRELVRLVPGAADTAAATPPVLPPAAAVPQRAVPDMLVTGTQRVDAVEQYKKLAATLHHVQTNRGVRVILCTSAVMSEGKTVTSANLALTLSQSFQRRVLLIDADLRRPRLHTLFNLPNSEGLFEALDARSDRKVVLNAVSPWLSVVTAGRPGPDPVHVLTSERLARVLEDAGSSFDWVIIDTPPVMVLPDAGLLMGLVDAAVLVIGAGQATYRMTRRAVDALGRDRIVGVVMNRVADSEVAQGYGGYYGYYAAADAAKG
jgi:capsular exopolysaccharide synthesis family protein